VSACVLVIVDHFDGHTVGEEPEGEHTGERLEEDGDPSGREWDLIAAARALLDQVLLDDCAGHGVVQKDRGRLLAGEARVSSLDLLVDLAAVAEGEQGDRGRGGRRAPLRGARILLPPPFPLAVGGRVEVPIRARLGMEEDRPDVQAVGLNDATAVAHGVPLYAI
jgi:hypothetical protein